MPVAWHLFCIRMTREAWHLLFGKESLFFMKKKKRRDLIHGYLFIAPWLIGFFAFTLFPLVYSLYLSFTDYNILSEAKWIGLGNYVKLLTKDDTVWVSLKVTLKFALVQVPLKLAVALFVAVLLSKKTKLLGAYRVVFYIPSLLGGSVAIALTWQKLWANHGVINSILESIGLSGYNWLTSTKTALYVLILLGVWQFGGSMLIFLAGLNDIPSSLVEAAIIDGANPITCFFKVKLPMLTPVLFYNLINAIIGCMQAFNSAYLITKGGPMNSTLYYGLYQYRNAFEYMNMGYAAALAWFMMLIILAMTALVFRSSSAWVYYQGE